MFKKQIDCKKTKTVSLRVSLPSALPFQESTLGKATWPMNASWPQMHHKNNRSYIALSFGRCQNTLWENFVFSAEKNVFQQELDPRWRWGGKNKKKKEKKKLYKFYI